MRKSDQSNNEKEFFTPWEPVYLWVSFFENYQHLFLRYYVQFEPNPRLNFLLQNMMAHWTKFSNPFVDINQCFWLIFQYFSGFDTHCCIPAGCVSMINFFSFSIVLKAVWVEMNWSQVSKNRSKNQFLGSFHIKNGSIERKSVLLVKSNLCTQPSTGNCICL